MKEPKFPLIYIDRKNIIDLINNVEALSYVKLSTADKKLNGLFYDANGKRWTCLLQSDELQKANWWIKLRILKIKVVPTFIYEEEYMLSDLKIAINICIDKDDDILTQFEEAHVIIAAVNKSNSFTDIVEVLNKYIFDVNEEEIWREQEKRGMVN